MALRVNSEVTVFDDGIERHGVVIDLKWGMVLVRFKNGETQWIAAKKIKA